MSRQVKILVPGGTHIVDLVGQRDELLRRIEGEFSSDILVRGNEITITGENDDAERAATVFEELLALVRQGQTLDDGLRRPRRRDGEDRRRAEAVRR